LAGQKHFHEDSDLPWRKYLTRRTTRRRGISKNDRDIALAGIDRSCPAIKSQTDDMTGNGEGLLFVIGLIDSACPIKMKEVRETFD